MEYLVEVWYPEHEKTTVTGDKLPDRYASFKERDSATVAWNSDGDEVLLVSVGDDYSVISMLSDGTWYYLVVSDDEEEVSVYMDGTDAYVPRKAMAPRELGLTVLQRADDFPGLRTDYLWDEQ